MAQQNPQQDDASSLGEHIARSEQTQPTTNFAGTARDSMDTGKIG